jgi:beta-glucosidase
VPLDAALKSLPVGHWTRLAVPLACFARAGADLTRVSDLFELNSASNLAISVSRVALGGEHDQLADCPPP